MSTNLVSPTSYRSSHTPAVTRRKWFIDLQFRKSDRLATAMSSSLVSASSSNNYDYSSPVGYSDQRIPDVTAQDEDERLFAKRSWDIALQPIKQLPMNLIFAWMAGNSFSLMSIMIVVMLFMKPIQAIFSISSAFQSIESEGMIGNVAFHKLIYFLGNLTHLALALYKCQSMGLLPTYASDWIAFAEPQLNLETTLGGLTY
ncbi:unnamed protein product [Didymodactylos carnosus]|uniref:ER membrane protein complex subunit 4 n=1 Tax=Didymodactylos carnosus TaxID=1234261 RepID=A0A813RW03_9BILA|nr:unnamed protein product [Didymodactylos carnosus]CAF0951921.1 unnamed protein product [Didymodactylos carnosus]CAF3570602.1 unnamed protein product [Didymodactylos carnosus]CAF3725975.1 unnamed protein product [Didymodactylos carnosus]